jgi:hypothetical protein
MRTELPQAPHGAQTRLARKLSGGHDRRGVTHPLTIRIRHSRMTNRITISAPGGAGFIKNDVLLTLWIVCMIYPR